MLKIAFITSNRVKLAHARYLARDYAVEITSKRQYGRAYLEPRSDDRDSLLSESFHDAYNRWVKAGANPNKDWFFIEDTSVIIDALSSKMEYPGLDVKYWMQRMTFSTLDNELKESGNNRSATIRSDVILYVPQQIREQLGTSDSCVSFTSRLKGKIASYESLVSTDLVYPWLDNRSFNKWFVPDGCLLPLSLLSIRDATQHDFRSAITKMLQHLTRHNVISTSKNQHDIKFVPPTFGTGSILLICGLPCSGKTTLGTFLSEKHGYYHIEASDFMRLAYYERHGAEPNVPLDLFAEHALRDTPSIVVERILTEMRRIGDVSIAITGFRSAKEIQIFRESYRGRLQVDAYFIAANQKIRYTRCCSRDRSDTLHNYADFKARDRLQNSMGLKPISTLLKAYTVRNNTTLIAYYDAFMKISALPMLQADSARFHFERRKILSLEYRVLLTLLSRRISDSQPLTTTEIASAVNLEFPNIGIITNKNNVSRYFNFKFHPYYKVRRMGKSLAYELSQTGIGRARSISHSVSTSKRRLSAVQLDLPL